MKARVYASMKKRRGLVMSLKARSRPPEEQARAAALVIKLRAARAARSFHLKQESNVGHKAFAPENTGAGKTRFMFDMKKGDLPGQTSLLDRVRSVEITKPVTSGHPRGPGGHKFGEQAARASTSKTPHTVTHGAKTGPEGPVQAVKSIRAFQEKSFGVSLFEGPKRGPGPVLAKAKVEIGRTHAAARLRALKPLADLQRNPEKYAQPGQVVDVKTEHIHFDPERFQYKLGHAARTGSVGSLSGVKKYDPELAGVVSVWRDPADSKVYVVNGHNRLELAKRLGVDKVTVKMLQAKDATEARGKGAIVNIAEGRGTAIDAAKFFRDKGITREDTEALGIPMRERIASEGINLAKLPPTLFSKVVSGELSTARASIIGGSGLSHAQQADIHGQIERLAKRGAVSDAALKEVIDNAKSAGVRSRDVFDLFGSSHEEQSLAIHRGTVQAAIKRGLMGEKKLFGLVSRSKAAEALAEKGRSTIDVETTGHVSTEAAQVLGVFDTLKNRSGPVAAHLNRAAERIANGENPATVTRETRERISNEIKRIFEGGGEAFAA